MKAVLNEYLLYSVPSHNDPELSEFPLNPGVSPGVLFCKTHNQFFHALRDRRPTVGRNGFLGASTRPLLCSPAQKGFITHNR